MLTKSDHSILTGGKIGLLWFLLSLSLVCVVTAAITDSMLAYSIGFAAWVVSYVIDRSG